MFDGYSFKIAQTTIAGTRTPNLQAQRTATINSKQLTDHVLSSIIRGRDVCRLLLLAGVALKGTLRGNAPVGVLFGTDRFGSQN